LTDEGRDSDRFDEVHRVRACSLACQEINGFRRRRNLPSCRTPYGRRFGRKRASISGSSACIASIPRARRCVRWALSARPSKSRHLPRVALHRLPVLHVRVSVRHSKYEWDSPLPKVQKCIMCYEKRVREASNPRARPCVPRARRSSVTAMRSSRKPGLASRGSLDVTSTASSVWMKPRHIGPLSIARCLRRAGIQSEPPAQTVSEAHLGDPL